MPEGAPNQNPEKPFIETLKARIEAIENVIQGLLQNNPIINAYNDLLAVGGLHLEKQISEHPDVLFFEHLRSMQNGCREQIDLINRTDNK